ncbi:glycerol-3-phosphate acyltransferase 4 [Perilla frutescens var. hirtella]|uniref:Glycerol-3-phosphate acyltransferase RAM2 n=1 Tax=Perilla frutescens var. hirtella TaxID=608512 RepID=A0AAD4NXQ5_PERFH|nr:glycerol-3-phosphate acyltransferase 4 [Perilla frutescens var. hirtella]KAH6770704.1 glycerol-3-phosphate acyltransferase 4 [Perilla frutescens var. hirtella]KAH6815676.1 glycerol-3-phosphate acyltransferase 4 [Perilla frutescens var. frutescens]
MTAAAAASFPSVRDCASTGRENDVVVADMDGTLLRGRSSFPYFALVAFEVGGALRLLFLLLLSPLAGILYYLISESAGIRVLIFATFAGMRVSDIESVARAVLPKFYSGDLHPESWRVFSACRKRCVLTANPRIMVEAFLKEFLGADVVLGTEVSTYRGRATGFVKPPGVLVGINKAHALKAAFADDSPQIGLGDRNTDFPFMTLCKESYIVPPKPEVKAVSVDKLPKPVIFHDGRLVQKPTPFLSLLIILWIPVGFLLACLRIAAGSLLPMPLVYYAFWALGVRVTVKGTPPPPVTKSSVNSGVLFICSHRTLLDPIFLSTALGRPIPAVTYSVSRLSEIISPIKTVRLSRDRATDAAMIKKMLKEGDLAICPEGTTCREPFLLRFSSLFAELTDELVPVAMVNRMSMFHGTTARGWKGMDPFYFFMNPSPAYEVTFLNKLPSELTSGAGKSSHEVANYIQRVIAATLSYECTTFTRKDKYRALAGNDGTVAEKPRLKSKQVMGC